uniref:RNA-dependent RNA polymerase n=1 Tax=Rhizoctonia solani mitovirus 6 TaxID=1708341 RepID=A0A0M4KGY6_9VIRU|nr:RNA-dependent RNA polymerase [Rhizoctonia solani mitovirus 6]
MRCISGQPLESSPPVQLDNEGWPDILAALKPIWKSGEPAELKLLTTLLTALRGIKLKAVLDTSTIETPWAGTDTITVKELAHAAKRLRFVKEIQTDYRKPHMSTKRGPLGQAILTSVNEVTLLPQQLIVNIITLGGSELATTIERLSEPLDILPESVCGLWRTLFPPKTSSIRRLSYFSDKEGKTRVIAILDYWSQSALVGLHKGLNALLRRIPSDCTFNQDAFYSKLPSQGPYYSFDLTAATDRMPLLLQKRVLSLLIGSAKAEAWANILVGTEFTLSDQSKRTVKYAAGQPMGAYSSWPAMALTHHVIVQVAALRAGLTRFWDYTLLGDDIVIAHAGVAEQYKALLSELDMPVSLAKTHVSQTTLEFAKRWIHNGTEITGFSIGGLVSVWKRYSLLQNFITTQHNHGWVLPLDGHPGLVTAILRHFRGASFITEHARRVVSLYMVFDSLLSLKGIEAGPVEAENFFSTLNTWFGLDVLSLCQAAKLDTALVLKWIRVEAKKRLVERDLESFQRDAYVVNDRLTSIAMERAGLACPEQQSFLRETLPVMINWYLPLVNVLNGLIDESMDLLIHLLDFTADRTDSYLNAGLNKYFVSKGVFTMRASHSITLAESAVTKMVITVAKELVNGQLTDLNDPDRNNPWPAVKFPLPPTPTE